MPENENLWIKLCPFDRKKIGESKYRRKLNAVRSIEKR